MFNGFLLQIKRYGDILKTYKLHLEYDGTDFAGWQIQPNERTVQSEVEKALEILTGETIRIVGSGRTDAGVHALDQVISFQCEKDLPLEAFSNGLNSLTPRDICFTKAELVSDEFNARRSAKTRLYEYHFLKRRRAIGRSYGWCPGFQFDFMKMKSPTKMLYGEHDWTSFCRAVPHIQNPKSTVLLAEWSESQDEILFQIQATSYFHNMVRIILGTLLEVGRGKMSNTEFEKLFTDLNRDLAGPTIPPQGLFLVKVEY
ncbi:tRNA pseudouridine(38-40) synthase TruA [candidate division KSB1 bacterium]|nr:tRNA pseudouridine(38-40) synthase TruA [candidate division KSB1 bacterium]